MSWVQLYAEVVALLGLVTVEAALMERSALVAVDDDGYRTLSALIEAIRRVSFHERHVRCALVDERTRRLLALALLDRSFLADVARTRVRLE